MTSRRAFAIALLAARAGALAIPARALADAPTLRFPADHGAHRDARIEWWYLTGALEAAARTWGFQITFFRAITGVTGAEASRFAARELLFAHAAVSDLEAQRLRHDQRIARSGFAIADAAVGDAALVIGDWRLARAERGGSGRYTARASSSSAAFAFDLELTTTQPLLAQGSAGVSRKGPRPEQTSRYYSEPQLAAVGTLTSSGPTVAVTGRAWLDHEWSDAYLDPDAVGWDWIGMNLDDGSALMAFRIRRADGSALWSGGSFRSKGGATGVTSPAPGDRLCAGSRLDQPDVQGALSGRVADRHAGRPLRGPCPARRSGARQPRQHRRGLLGGPVAARGQPRHAPRPRLSRDDRLRGAPRAVRRVAQAQCAPAASTATFRAGLASQTRTSNTRNRVPDSKNISSTASV